MSIILDRLGKMEDTFADGQERVEAKLDASVAAIRSQIDAGDDKRLSKEVFEQFEKTNNTRIERLEQSPMRVLAWLGFATGLGGPLLTIVLYVLAHR